MKGFTREHTEFSLCGLACLLCPMQVGGYCPGCGGGSGNQSCAIARCSLEQGGPEFCSECVAYPCARYDEFDTADSFVPHSRRAADLARAGEMGLDAWLALLRQKRAVLDELLADWNDRPPKVSLLRGRLSAGARGSAPGDGGAGRPKRSGRRAGKRAGPGRRRAAANGGGPGGHQPEAEQGKGMSEWQRHK